MTNFLIQYKSTIITFISLFVVLFTLGSFLTGAEIIEHMLFNIVPIGNLLVPAGLISISILSLQIERNSKLLIKAGYLSILGALLWLPIGILLAGNSELNFVNDGQDSATFEILTIIIVGLTLLVFLSSIVIRIIRKFTRQQVTN